MTSLRFSHITTIALILLASRQAQAQQFESLGTRALGMGGAFVAVADDATAVYWNPAGIATGPTFNLLFDWAAVERGDEGDRPLDAGTTAENDSAQMVALGLPSLGLSYYRIRSTAIRSGAGTTTPPGAVVDSLMTHQIGATVAQTLIADLVVGTTIRVIRGAVSSGLVLGDRVREVLDAGADLDGQGTTRLDLDVGALYSFSGGRLGLSVRNLREATFDGPTPADPALKLQRLIRLGAALTPGRHGAAPPTQTTIAVDVDLTDFTTASGEQRNLAVGGEHWLGTRHLGVRGGFRVNTLESSQRVGSVGLSVSAGKGLYLEGQWTHGTRTADRSWAASARMTF